MADAQLVAQLKLDATQYNQEMKRATEAAKSATSSIDSVSSEINKVSLNSNQAAASVNSLTSAVIGYVSVQKLIAASDEWTTLNNRIRLTSSTLGEFNAAQQAIVSISQTTGQALGSIGSTYQSIARSQKELGLNQKQTLELTETISKAMVIGGGTAEGNAAALAQLSQAFSSGVLRGEEFNSVMEQAPGLAKAMADGLNAPVGSLRGMANDGKLTADVVTKALMKMKDSVDTQFKTMNLTISQSFEVLKTGFTQFIGQTNEATGAARVISTAIQTMGKNVDVAASALLTFAAVGVVPYLYAGTTAVVGFSAAAVTSAASVHSLSAALALLRSAAVSVVAALGPLGIAAAAAAAVAAYIGLSKESDNVNASLVSQASAVKELKSAYAELAPYQKGAAFDEINKQLITANKNITKLRQNAPDALMVNDASLNKALQDAQDGVTTVSASLGELNKNGFFKENSKEVMQWSADYDMARGEVERLNRSLDVLNGKQEESIKKSVYLDFDTSTSAPSASAVQIQADITGISKQFTDLGANIGLSSEQIKLNTAVKKLEEEQAKAGNSEATIATLKRAEADAQGAQAAIDKYKADKEAADEAKKKTELDKQNAKAVEDMIAAKEREVATIGMTSAQIAAYDAELKGATLAQQNHLSELQAVTDAYKDQKEVMKSLEGIIDGFNTAGMSAIDKQLYRLEQKGATSDQLATAKYYLEATESITQTAKDEAASIKQAEKETKKKQDKEQKAAEKMLLAAEKMDKSTTEEVKKAKSPLSLDGKSMSFFKGSGWFNDHVDQDPTGLKGLQKAYPEYYSKSGVIPKAGGGGYVPSGTGAVDLNGMPKSQSQDMGTINISITNEQGIAKLFPLLGVIQTLTELKSFVDYSIGSYGSTGASANS